MEFPDELWELIKDYQIDYTIKHKRKMRPSLKYINGLYCECETYYTDSFRGIYNLNDRFNSMWYFHNLCITSVGWNLEGRKQWWYGFGWKKIKRRKMEFPDELWELIKDYQIDYKKNHTKKLRIVHDEMMETRPVCYYAVEVGKSPSDDWWWDKKMYFNIPTEVTLTHQSCDRMYRRKFQETLYLHSIEVGGERKSKRWGIEKYRHCVFYYGWYNLKREDKKTFENLLSNCECQGRFCCPIYY